MFYMNWNYLTLMLLVANLTNTKLCYKPEKWQALEHEYSSQSAQQELSNEYQHDRV